MFAKLLSATVLGLALTTVTPAHAASFERIIQMEDGAHEDLASHFEHMEGYWELDHTSLFVHRRAYRRGPNQTPDKNMLKQLVYKLRGDGLAPKKVIVRALSKTEQNYKVAISAAVKNIPSATEQDKASLRHSLVEAIEIASASSLYTIEDANDFGACSALAVVDDHALEVLVISSCWYE